MQEFIQGLSVEQLIGFSVAAIGAVFAVGSALFKIISYVISNVFRIVRSNTDRLNGHDIQHATVRADLKHIQKRGEHHENRITDLERK